jgi:hypothetical protein
MANEITYNTSLVASSTNFTERIEPGSLSIDLANVKMESGVMNIDTTAAGVIFVLANTPITNGGMFFFRNLSATITVEVGTQVSGAFVSFLSLKAGEYASGRLSSGIPDIPLAAKAASSTVDLQFKVFDGA